MADTQQLEHDNPDAYRMTLGDHLEELRHRLILGIAGFAIAAAGCLFFGKNMLALFCRPLIDAMAKSGVNPTLVMGEVSDGFMRYLEISLIMAVVIAAPWIVWQLWQFVAAGLYPNERKVITKYVPLSIALLIAGDLFVYFFVLPLTLQFFLAFSLSIPMPEGRTAVVSPTTQPMFLQVPTLAGNPALPPELGMWYDSYQQRLKIVVDGKIRTLQFGADNLLSPMYQLNDYIELVLNSLIVFALSFQLPLVVLTLTKINIVDVQMLRNIRRYVYFGLAVLACAIMPADAITAATGLLIPLIVLYELGIFLSARSAKESPADV